MEVKEDLKKDGKELIFAALDDDVKNIFKRIDYDISDVPCYKTSVDILEDLNN